MILTFVSFLGGKKEVLFFFSLIFPSIRCDDDRIGSSLFVLLLLLSALKKKKGKSLINPLT